MDGDHMATYSTLLAFWMRGGREKAQRTSRPGEGAVLLREQLLVKHHGRRTTEEEQEGLVRDRIREG
jgi:hypothetical protein